MRIRDCGCVVLRECRGGGGSYGGGPGRVTLAAGPPGTPLPTAPRATGGPQPPAPGRGCRRRCFGPHGGGMGRGAWGASWRGGGVGRSGGRGGGQLKRGRANREAGGRARRARHKARGIIPGASSRGSSCRGCAPGRVGGHVRAPLGGLRAVGQIGQLGGGAFGGGMAPARCAGGVISGGWWRRRGHIGRQIGQLVRGREPPRHSIYIF